MAQAAITVDGLKTLEVALDVTAKIALDEHLLRGDGGDDCAYLFWAELPGPDVRVDVGLLQDPLGGLGADSVNVIERGFDTLFAGDFYAEESWHDGMVVGFLKK